MFVLTIILGLFLYLGHCFKANDDISTRRQSRNSQLYYNSANYQPTQDIYYNNEAKLNSNYNNGPSQNNNFNYAPSQNSNFNYAPSQNSNFNYAPSQNSNYNYAPWQNSNYNYAPWQNTNYKYAPSQNANHNNELNFNSYGNMTYAGAGIYGGQRIPSDRLVYLTYSRLDELSRDHQTISNFNRYHYPTSYKAEIGGTPVPMFREFPKFLSDLPPVNVTPYPQLPSTLIPFPPFENNPRISPASNPSQNERVVGFGDIESRNSNMTTAASPDDLGFDDNPDPPEMVERFQWQVSVFSKEVSARVRVCGGSLVTSSVVISAARCFWSVGPLSAELFAAGAGEAASGQANNYEAYQYRRDVRDIRLPPRFRGAASSFQDDLAVVVLARPLPPALKPVCVGFDWELDEQQLADGSDGMVNSVPTVKSMRVLDKKVENWSLDMRNQRVPYIGIEECLREAPEDQLRYITSDKFCAGFRGVKEARACSPDTGSGLVYFQDSPSIPFLRGVVSLQLGDSCVTAFTHVGTHRAFLLRHVSGLEAECARHYPGAGGVANNKGGGDEFVCNCYC